MAKLSPKQEMFCQEYLIDLNATQAAIRAGYSPLTAGEQGSRLLKNVNIRTRIDKAMAERSRRTGVNADRIVLELARIGFANPTKVIDSTTGNICVDDEDETAAISSIKVKKVIKEDEETIEREVRFHDKNKSLELLMKHQGMFNDNPIINNNVNVSNPLEGLTTDELKNIAKLADKDD